MTDISNNKRPGIFSRIRRLERKVETADLQWVGDQINTLDTRMGLAFRCNARQMVYIDQINETLWKLGVLTAISFFIIFLVAAILIYVLHMHLSSK